MNSQAAAIRAIEAQQAEQPPRSAARLRELEKRLAQADGDTAVFKALFDSWQEAYEKMMEALARVGLSDGGKAEKLKSAVRAAAAGMAP